MATYNGELFVEEQVRSILSQLSPSDELIVSDDHSSDKTIELIRAIGDPRVKIFLNTGKRGFCGNFESAITQASGDHIFLSDQDDVWLPDKIARMLAVLQTSSLVVCDCTIVDEKLGLLCASFFQHRKSGAGLVRNFLKNSYMGNCMAFRRELLGYALPFPARVSQHDVWIGFVAELLGFETRFLPVSLSLYRRHRFNISNSYQRVSPPSWLLRIAKRWILVSQIPAIWCRRWKIKRRG